MITHAVLRFRARRTTVDPRSDALPAVLVTDGLNGWTRNPMYVGMVLVLLGHAVGRRSTSAILPGVAFVAWLELSQIPAEEDLLSDTFGCEYRRYAGRVRRWV